MSRKVDSSTIQNSAVCAAHSGLSISIDILCSLIPFPTHLPPVRGFCETSKFGSPNIRRFSLLPLASQAPISHQLTPYFPSISGNSGRSWGYSSKRCLWIAQRVDRNGACCTRDRHSQRSREETSPQITVESWTRVAHWAGLFGSRRMSKVRKCYPEHSEKILCRMVYMWSIW